MEILKNQRFSLLLIMVATTLHFACARQDAPPPPAAGPDPAPSSTESVAAFVQETRAAMAAAPRAFALTVKRDDQVTREGELLFEAAKAGSPRFVLTWAGDPGSLVSSDGESVYASQSNGDVLVSHWARAGSPLFYQEAGSLVPAALDPSAFAGYVGEILPEENGTRRLRTPLPNGGGWGLEVSGADGLPRRLTFQGDGESPVEVLELEPIDAPFPSDPGGFRLEPTAGGTIVEFFAGPAPGDLAPAVTFELADGTSVSLEDLRGSAVALDFWATWCVPCRPAMQELQALHEELGERGLRVFGLRLFDSGDAKPFLDELGVTYPIGDGAPLAGPYAVETYGLPTLYILDREGRVVDIALGFRAGVSGPRIRAAVLEALGG